MPLCKTFLFRLLKIVQEKTTKEWLDDIQGWYRMNLDHIFEEIAQNRKKHGNAEQHVMGT